MAQTYTMEEAAQRLSLSPEEFKRRLKTEWTQIRSFRDGATLRFRAADIDELSRLMGESSDPGLQLGPVSADPPPPAADEFLFAPEPSGIKAAADDHPLLLADEPEFALAVDSGSKKIPTPPDDATD
ncbi:MAG: hypothetical protein ACRC7O_03895, partial [Fimbriiglobus sp.]